jgi:hypothetical protein
MSRLVKMVTNVSTASVPIQTLNICQKLFGAFTKDPCDFGPGQVWRFGPVWADLGNDGFKL